MSRERPLHGSCSCSRIRYTVTVPPNTTDLARIIFSQDAAHRRSQASPLSAWLRVPLTWYSSSTHALHSDETHHTIRRSYTSPTDAASQRHFCGYCGTPLSYWSEEPPSEAEYISVTLGSLHSKDLRDLEELLPEGTFDDSTRSPEERDVPSDPSKDAKELYYRHASCGLPWFEAMIEGSRLGGNLRKSRGVGLSQDGNVKVEWEIMEWTDGGEAQETPGTGKRKLDETADRDDVMQQ